MIPSAFAVHGPIKNQMTIDVKAFLQKYERNNLSLAIKLLNNNIYPVKQYNLQ